MRSLLFVCCPLFLHAAGTTLAVLPNSTVRAVKVDAGGNIYVAGSQGAAAASDAFVAKLSPTGAVLYSTTLAGSAADTAVAIDIDVAGDAYISGQTDSADFPVTPGALQTTMQAASGQGFAAKLDNQGKVVYATYIGGSALVDPGRYGILADSAGDAIISGQTIGGVFPTTPGAPFTSRDQNTFFVMKLDPPGAKLLGAVRGLGGLIALDSQGNIYIAGVEFNAPTSIPVTAGAFQNTYRGNACAGDAQLDFGCAYQYIVKLNAALTQITYATYIDGSYGATPAAISVDAMGNVFVAGTTNSPDYPTTPDALEPVYIADAPPPGDTCIGFCVFSPPTSGYLTKLNATGTGLIYSTYYSGTETDAITFAAFTANGIYLSGTAGSTDLPGFDGYPSQCLPQTYTARLSADGTEAGAARAARGSTILAYDPATGMLLGFAGNSIVAFDLNAPPPSIACILDAADLKPVNFIAPGELLSIFGAYFTGIASTPARPLSQFPASLNGVGVTVNGISSPLLYVAPQQIDLQVPFEIAGASQANIALANAPLNIAGMTTIPVQASNPVAFLDTTAAVSQATPPGCLIPGGEGNPIPLAFNADGSRNTCTHTAPPGSVVRIFLEGLGVTSPPQITGAVTQGSGLPLNLPITIYGLQATVIDAMAAPGSISGVWQVDIRMPPDQTGAIPLSLTIGGVPVRDANLTIWVQ